MKQVSLLLLFFVSVIAAKPLQGDLVDGMTMCWSSDLLEDPLSAAYGSLKCVASDPGDLIYEHVLKTPVGAQETSVGFEIEGYQVGKVVAMNKGEHRGIVKYLYIWNVTPTATAVSTIIKNPDASATTEIIFQIFGTTVQEDRDIVPRVVNYS